MLIKGRRAYFLITILIVNGFLRSSRIKVKIKIYTFYWSVVITWLLFNRKEVREKLNNIGMPLCSFANLTVSMSVPRWSLGEGNGQQTLPNKVWVTWEGDNLSVSHTWVLVINQDRYRHCKGSKPACLRKLLNKGSSLSCLSYLPVCTGIPVAGGTLPCICPDGPWPCRIHTMV